MDTIHSNEYVKIQDDNVSMEAILHEVGARIGLDAKELVLLDSKFMAISDDAEIGS